jgi:hypothetical protein
MPPCREDKKAIPWDSATALAALIHSTPSSPSWCDARRRRDRRRSSPYCVPSHPSGSVRCVRRRRVGRRLLGCASGLSNVVVVVPRPRRLRPLHVFHHSCQEAFPSAHQRYSRHRRSSQPPTLPPRPWLARRRDSILKGRDEHAGLDPLGSWLLESFNAHTRVPRYKPSLKFVPWLQISENTVVPRYKLSLNICTLGTNFSERLYLGYISIYKCSTL